MQRCPNCEEETISNLSKFMLGPGRTIECGNCKARISVSWYTLLIVIVIIVLINQINNTYDSGESWMIFVALMIVYTYIHWKFIPLRVRKRKGE